MNKKTEMKKTKLHFILVAMLVLALSACSTTGTQTAADGKAKAAEKEVAIAKIKEMIANGDKVYKTEEILPYYDQLDPVGQDFMLGTWKGGKFDGGKPDAINWYGKRFNSRDDVEPLLAQKPDGTVYSFDMWGMAYMRDVLYRDKVSATLIYNKKPILDYFRKVDDDTLLGLGEAQGKVTFFFYLKREKQEG